MMQQAVAQMLRNNWVLHNDDAIAGCGSSVTRINRGHVWMILDLHAKFENPMSSTSS